MNLNTSIVKLYFLDSEGLQGIHIKIDDIDPKERFVNLFDNLALCANVDDEQS